MSFVDQFLEDNEDLLHPSTNPINLDTTTKQEPIGQWSSYLQSKKQSLQDLKRKYNFYDDDSSSSSSINENNQDGEECGK